MTQFFRWTILLCLAVGLTAAPQAESETDPKPDAKVGGTVISAKTGEPLRGARLTLEPNRRGRQQDARQQTTTDLNGRFLFTEVAAGEYRLSADKTGYESNHGPRTSRALKLSQNQSKTKLLISLRPAAVISGRVLDSYGEPLAGVRVGAFRRNFQPGEEEWSAVEGATTDDLGEYRMYGLAMGKYIVGVAPQQEPSQAGAFVYEQVPAFYPGVADPDEAATLKVSWGSELDAIDLKLAAAPATAVSGILADGDTGEPLEGYLRLGTTNGAQLGSFTTTKDGRFVLYGLPQTELAISGVVRQGRDMLTAHAKVYPSASRVEEVELLVRSGRPISGEAVLEDPPEQAPGEEAGESQGRSGGINIWLNLLEGRSFRRPLRTRVPAEGGAFEISGVQPGEYRVAAYAPEGAYLRAIARAGKPLDGFVMTIPPDGEITDLELRFATDGGTVTGTVGESGFDSEGWSPDIRVFAIPDDPERVLLPISVEVADDGSFEITAIPPGGYTLFAASRRSAIDLWDPDVRQALRASGEHVSLKPNGTATVELNVIKEPDEPL